MKLLSMVLNNFQGIRELTLAFDGSDRTIRGDNATGKTTIANAQSWLLTGKSSEDEKNYSPKTEKTSGLEHSAECVYELDDGRIVKLKKILKEKYTKKRGSTTAEFSGHEVLHYIDDVPVKEKEYQERLSWIFGNIENIQILTNVAYFAKTMKWDKRRALLMDVCGDYSDDYIIASNAELIPLTEILAKPGNAEQRYTVDEYVKLTKDKMKKINNEINAIPARIDEANRAIPSIDESYTKEELENTAKSFNVELAGLQKDMASLKAGNTAELKKKEIINEINLKMRNARIDHQAEYSSKNSEIQNKINEISSKVIDLKSKINSRERSISNSRKDIEYMSKRRDELRNEYMQVAAAEWDSSKEVCPTCGQVLPGDRIDELKAKFNLDKSIKLEEINKKGQSVSKTAIADVESLITKLEKERESLGTDLILNNNRIQELENSRPKLVPFEDTETYRVLNEELQKVRMMSSDEPNGKEVQAIADKIELVQDNLKSVNDMLYKYDIKEFQLKRIEILKETQRTLSADYEKFESYIYLCEQFIKTKVSMITDRINERFSNVSFKLFDIQVNGGLKECCEIMIPSPNGTDVPYASSNNAAKINAGLEVIEVLQEHFKARPPIFVDNAESVTELRKMNSQVIRLVVDKNYKELYMEE